MAGHMRNIHEEEIIHNLMEVFGANLDLQIIHSVALNSKFDLETASNTLIELCLNLDDREKLGGKKEECKKKHTHANLKSLRSSHNSNVASKFLALQKNNKPDLNMHEFNKETKLNCVIQNINQGFKVLVLLRGLPGSGKSTFAKKIIQKTVGANYYEECIMSTDDYFTHRGMYKFEPSRLEEAHTWNKTKAISAMKRGVSPIIIDNTNTQMWEMEIYAASAMTFSYIIEVLEPSTSWLFNDKELARKNTHGVPRIKIKEMIERYEKDITAEVIMKCFKLKYIDKKPPQLRSYPPIMFNEISTNERNCSVDSDYKPALKTPDLFAPQKHIIRVEPSAPDNKSGKLSDSAQCLPLNNSSKTSMNCAQSARNYSSLSSDIEFSGILRTFEHKMSIDDILNCGTTDHFADVLQPKNSKPSSQYPNLNLEEAWGVSEKALFSWDIVTPISDKKNVEVIKITSETSGKVVTKENSTNTYSVDFLVLNGNGDLSDNCYQFLKCNSREINECYQKSPTSPVLSKALIHKSTMTDEIEDVFNININDSKVVGIKKLISLFPDVSVDALNDMYEKCSGDLNWIVDLLLEDNKVPFNSNLDEEITKINEPDKKPIENQHAEVKESLLVGGAKRKTKNNNKPSSSEGSSFDEIEEDDMDDFEFVQLSEIGSNNSNRMGEEETEFMELDFGDQLIAQLEQKFGDTSLFCPKGYKPVVQLPETLARQLYTFYVESVYQQMENEMVKQDEEIARKIEQQEQENIVKISADNANSNAQSLATLSHQSNDSDKEIINQWTNLSAEDIATRLTKQKLYSMFPSLDVNQISEIYEALGSDYKETVNALLASTPEENISKIDKNLLEPPIPETVVNEIKQSQNEIKQLNAEAETLRTAVSYRDEAFNYLEKREELYKKAQKYYQRGMTQAAQIYSALAQQQTNLYEQANHMAATAFLNEHSERHQNFDTIDLHFLFVKEAVAALDIFIDRNINLLQGSEKNTQFLFVITGRGKRSENGISKLKPAVIARLKKRKIGYCHLNPGLLKIRVNQNSLVTSDV